MIAVQNNAVIHARGLVIEQDDKSDPKRIVAEGPHGWMELNESSSPAEGAKPKPLQIHWQDKLVMDKKPEVDNFAFQITGSVEVQHDEWALTCQKLKGLLVPVEGTTADATRRRRLEPIKLEAEGSVSFHSPQAVSVSETLLMDILNKREPEPPRVLPRKKRPIPNRCPPPKPPIAHPLCGASPHRSGRARGGQVQRSTSFRRCRFTRETACRATGQHRSSNGRTGHRASRFRIASR